MRIIAIVVLVVGVIISGQVAGQTSLSGIVVDDEGKPLAGVEFWLGQPLVSNTGISEMRTTGPNGRFACSSVSVDQLGQKKGPVIVAFHHPDYAPTWVNAKDVGSGPVTVSLDKGIELRGVAATNGTREEFGSSNHLLQWPLQVRLDCTNANSQHAWRLHTETDSEGHFTFRIPTNYTESNFTLHFAGTSVPLPLRSEVPLPVVKIRAEVTVELDKDDRAASAEPHTPAEELASAE